MAEKLRNKVALITASSRGLGFACAKALASEGASIAICARQASRLHDAEAELAKAGAQVFSTACDLSKPDDGARLFEEVRQRFGGIDILVYNHGHPPSGMRFSETPLKHWRDTYTQCIESAVNLCQLVVPAMQKQNWGRLIFLNSISAKEPDPRYFVSSCIRPGLLGLAKCLSREYGSRGITANSILMGCFDTELLHTLAEEEGLITGASKEQILQKLAEGSPQHRLGDPKLLGQLVAFLASADGGLINGAAIPADGGHLRSMI